MTNSISLPSGRVLVLDAQACVMGIVNCTPDSFYAGSRNPDLEAAVSTGLAMAESGAAILDIGGESTRPGSRFVDLAQEMDRVIPVIQTLRSRLDAQGRECVILSVDTRKSAIAREALRAGADIINDVSALEDDADMRSLAAESGCAVVLMHKKGIPESMQDKPYYADCVNEISECLLLSASRAQAAGIGHEKIILDPGFGFGKRLEDNLDLLSRLDDFVASGYPVLVGLSRKSFIGAMTGRPPEGRLSGTLSATVMARARGAVIFRVHDVEETVDVLAVFDQVQRHRNKMPDKP